MSSETLSTADNSRRGNHLMLGINITLFVISLALANWHDTWTAALAVGLPALAAPALMAYLLPVSRATRIVYATTFMVFAGLLIHQSHGMIEMHFSIFVLLAFLLYYRDIVPILVGAGVIALHHLGFNYLQEAGYPVYVFEMRMGLQMVLLHAVFVIAETAVLVIFARRLAVEGEQAESLYNGLARITQDHPNIDISVRVNANGNELSDRFNGFMGSIAGALGSARNAAVNLSTSAIQLKQTAGNAAKGASAQRTSSSQAAAAIHQVAQTAVMISDNARSAQQAADKAAGQVRDGNTVVHSTRAAAQNMASRLDAASGAVTTLAKDSENVGTVVEVIRAIAEQTNLLALNAAIEAARAGEQGRGFAVVADEVRTLAARTSKSTQEISDIIERLQAGASNVVEEMQQSTELAKETMRQTDQAAQALEAVKRAVEEMHELNAHIAVATGQQSSAMSEINRNITEIDHEAHTIADGVEETLRTADDLAGAASALQETVAHFRF